MNIYIISERGMCDLEKWEMFMKFNRYKTLNKINIGLKNHREIHGVQLYPGSQRKIEKYWGIRERCYRKMHCNTQHNWTQVLQNPGLHEPSSQGTGTQHNSLSSRLLSISLRCDFKFLISVFSPKSSHNPPLSTLCLSRNFTWTSSVRITLSSAPNPLRSPSWSCAGALWPHHLAFLKLSFLVFFFSPWCLFFLSHQYPTLYWITVPIMKHACSISSLQKTHKHITRNRNSLY